MGCGEVSYLHEQNPADNHPDPLFSPTDDKIGKWRRPKVEARTGDEEKTASDEGDDG